MGRLLPAHLSLLLAAIWWGCVPAAVRSALVYGPDYLVDGNQLVDMQYHMGPVLSASPTNLYLIWYGRWEPAAQAVLRDFLASLSAPAGAAPSPSVSDWWARAPRLYTDQTGANVTGSFVVAGEHADAGYSHSAALRRSDVQSVIRSAVYAYPDPLPLDPYSGAYLVLTSPDVRMDEFCRAVCGFHYFTFASVVGVTVPYAWVGNSGAQCPGKCAYPFAAAGAEYGGGGQAVLRPPNGDAGLDGMVIVLGHELAEMATNPLVNAWYAGDTPTAPTEIADLCLGVYGDGGGAAGLVGNVSRAPDGTAYNVHGVNGRRFLLQWLWNPVRAACYGPNASD